MSARFDTENSTKSALRTPFLIAEDLDSTEFLLVQPFGTPRYRTIYSKAGDILGLEAVEPAEFLLFVR